MDIPITEFKHRCLEIIREVEASGARITITRRGRPVAQLSAAGPERAQSTAEPWEQLQRMGGRLLATPEESVLRDEDFEAMR